MIERGEAFLHDGARFAIEQVLQRASRGIERIDLRWDWHFPLKRCAAPFLPNHKLQNCVEPGEQLIERPLWRCTCRRIFAQIKFDGRLRLRVLERSPQSLLRRAFRIARTEPRRSPRQRCYQSPITGDEIAFLGFSLGDHETPPFSPKQAGIQTTYAARPKVKSLSIEPECRGTGVLDGFAKSRRESSRLRPTRKRTIATYRRML